MVILANKLTSQTFVPRLLDINAHQTSRTTPPFLLYFLSSNQVSEPQAFSLLSRTQAAPYAGLEDGLDSNLFVERGLRLLNIGDNRMGMNLSSQRRGHSCSVFRDRLLGKK
jgi:hypothetical protein